VRLVPASAPPLTAGVGAVLLLALLLGGCRDTPPEERRALLELAGDTIELPATTSLIEIRLSAPGGTGQVTPDRAEATTGDVIRFVAVDGRGYAVRFDTAAMSPEQAEFLAGTNQLASPPLLGANAAWVVNLENAPPGEYPFVSASHGVPGVLVVR
jgi:plastocyanin